MCRVKFTSPRTLCCAASAGAAGGGGHKGKLDYGIDGPLMGNGEVALAFEGGDAQGGTDGSGGAAEASPSGHAIVLEDEAPGAAAVASLPHFLQRGMDAQGGGEAAAAANGAVAAAVRCCDCDTCTADTTRM